MTLMCAHFKTETDASQNRIDDFFSNFELFRGPSHRQDFMLNKYGGTGLIFEKTVALLAELWKQPPVVIPREAIFYNVVILCFWRTIIRSSDQGVQFMRFFLHIHFLMILIVVTEQLYRQKIICGCFRSLWLWLLLII